MRGSTHVLMHDNWLIAIALSVSATGIIVLLVLLVLLEPGEIGIAEVPGQIDGAALAVRGTVDSVSHRGDLTVLEISQSCTIDAVVFERVEIAEGICIRAIGKKGTYEGTPQLVVSRITEC